MSRVYLDWNATAPLRPEAREAMLAAMDVVGNPSSVHAEGRAAKAIVEKAREQVAALVGCAPAEVVFTSGATEAASFLALRRGGGAVFVQDTAHDCLWTHFDLTEARDNLRDPRHLLAMGLANGETGVITRPERDADGWIYGAAARAGWLLLDISQAAGRIPVSFADSGAIFAILTAHKFGGPKGMGALIVREGHEFTPAITGGGQEMGRRSGTENITGIAGTGAAAEAALRDLESGVWADVERLRDALEDRLAAEAGDIIYIGKDSPRLPNTSCFAVPGWRGDTQVMQMDLAGYAISAGSACSSGKVKESRVLRAMGYDAQTASSAIRVSIGPTTTEAEVMGFAEVWLENYRRWKQRAA